MEIRVQQGIQKRLQSDRLETASQRRKMGRSENGFWQNHLQTENKDIRKKASRYVTASQGRCTHLRTTTRSNYRLINYYNFVKIHLCLLR